MMLESGKAPLGEQITENSERILLHCEVTEQNTCARIENINIRYGMCGLEQCITCAAKRTSVFSGEDYQIETSAILRYWRTMKESQMFQDMS
eukprot:1532366-Heterocapsa_arctica.AAC.1